MLAADSNYNSLGKLGPHYDRPEYRPPAAGQEKRPAAARPGDRLSLRRPAPAEPVSPAVPVPAANTRLNLTSAQALARDLAAQITSLPPHSTTREPHAWLRTSLLAPVYV